MRASADDARVAAPGLIGREMMERVTRSWGRSPVGVRLATARTQVAAALWADDRGATEELTAEVSVAVNALCIACDRTDLDTSIGGRLLHSGTVAEGAFNIVRPGERSRGVNRGTWERLHIYLPDDLLREIALEAPFGAPDRAIELINPVWGFDPAIVRIGREFTHEIRTDQPLSRLRLDTLSQDLAITLLRSHSSLSALFGRRAALRRGGLAPWQLRRATEAMQARLDGDIGLAELARMCGVSAAHFSRAFRYRQAPRRSCGFCTGVSRARRICCSRAGCRWGRWPWRWGFPRSRSLRRRFGG